MTTHIMKRANNGHSALPSTSLSGWVDQLFQDNLNRFFGDDSWGSGSTMQRIPVNLRETDKTYEMELVAPGMKKEDFNLQLNSDLLTVSFEKKEDNEEENKEEGWLRREYMQQSFSRSFRLDETVDVNKIEAHYTDGVLHLTIPKKEHAQKISKKIEIR